jgi:hypothetical protein
MKNYVLDYNIFSKLGNMDVAYQCVQKNRLSGLNVGGLLALGSLSHFKSDLLTFLE